MIHEIDRATDNRRNRGSRRIPDQLKSSSKRDSTFPKEMFVFPSELQIELRNWFGLEVKGFSVVKEKNDGENVWAWLVVENDFDRLAARTLHHVKISIPMGDEAKRVERRTWRVEQTVENEFRWIFLFAKFCFDRRNEEKKRKSRKVALTMRRFSGLFFSWFCCIVSVDFHWKEKGKSICLVERIFFSFSVCCSTRTKLNRFRSLVCQKKERKSIGFEVLSTRRSLEKICLVNPKKSFVEFSCRKSNSRRKRKTFGRSKRDDFQGSRCRAESKFSPKIWSKVESIEIFADRSIVEGNRSIDWRKNFSFHLIDWLRRRTKKNVFLRPSSLVETDDSSSRVKNSFLRILVQRNVVERQRDDKTDRPVSSDSDETFLFFCNRFSSFSFRHENFNSNFGVEWIEINEMFYSRRSILEESNNEQENQDDSSRSNSTNQRALIVVKSVHNNNTRLPAHIWRYLAKVRSSFSFRSETLRYSSANPDGKFSHVLIQFVFSFELRQNGEQEKWKALSFSRWIDDFYIQFEWRTNSRPRFGIAVENIDWARFVAPWELRVDTIILNRRRDLFQVELNLNMKKLRRRKIPSSIFPLKSLFDAEEQEKVDEETSNWSFCSILIQRRRSMRPASQRASVSVSCQRS